MNESIQSAVGTVRYASTTPATAIKTEAIMNRITACFSLAELSLNELVKMTLNDSLS